MAQGRVTDFFSKRKSNTASLQPSKRQKFGVTTETVENVTNKNPYRNLTAESEELVDNVTCDQRDENAVFSPVQTRAGRKAKAVKISTTKSSTRTRKANVDPKQKLLPDVFTTSKEEHGPKETLVDSLVASMSGSTDVSSTPTKVAAPKAQAKTGRRTKRGKVEEDMAKKQDEATPEKIAPVPNNPSSLKSKKKLEMKEPDSCKKEDSADILIQATPDPISPLHPTPEHLNTTNKPAVKMSDNVAAAMEKCKSLGKVRNISVDAVQEKLSNIDNLDDLKNRLESMKQIRQKLKTRAVPELKKFDQIEVKVEVPSEEAKVEKKAPAYERFHHLATPAAPTLTLPYKYRMLAEHFRGMDQVVSMLHNRNEVCTFSKLKVAVQQFTKRNFEKGHVAQIKTVLPTAYELRQEKGLPNSQGFRENKYQLTVEAKLDSEEKTSKGRPTFKPSDILSRRTAFHSSLIHIVKQHHKEFLSTLDRPLTVPDHKITRWHPRFPLDEVPDVKEAELPQPPDVQVFQTAKDVLENTRGKLDPKVEKALEATVKETEPASLKPEPVSVSASPVSATGALKGLPSSLVEKIRAKEAALAAAALTRDPKEDKRHTMLNRLPDLMRIIRSYFVTEKKPSIPLDLLIQKVMDSYKSCLAAGDVEPHINLCVEIAPEWISIIKIQKGRYVKIDKNIDLKSLTDKVNNMMKARK